ncbi:hypothetical protein Plec18167_009388 [Paecilomyces lecythidis]|uniref:Uncharacterized protein n=1 Tax=Paecilomyces lecythidis TaxID=3004212 RepID=A0ABR3WQ67_9EURO
MGQLGVEGGVEAVGWMQMQMQIWTEGEPCLVYMPFGGEEGDGRRLRTRDPAEWRDSAAASRPGQFHAEKEAALSLIIASLRVTVFHGNIDGSAMDLRGPGLVLG